MLESKTKTQFNLPENKYSQDNEEIYCSVEELKTRNIRKPCVTAQPIRGALKELAFNKVFILYNNKIIYVYERSYMKYECNIA